RVAVTGGATMGIGEVGPPPEAEVDGPREGLHIGEGAVDLVDGLGPFDRLPGLRSRAPDHLADRAYDLAAPVAEGRDVIIDRLRRRHPGTSPRSSSDSLRRRATI